MLGGVEIRLKLQANKPAFYLHCDADYDVQVKFDNVALFVTHAKVAQNIMTAHEKALTASPAKYPITRVEVRQYVVPSQTKSTTFQNKILVSIFLIEMLHELQLLHLIR